MIKELLINGAVNRYALSNRARQAIAFQYITDTKTLRLIDTYNNVAVDLVTNGDNALTSSAMEQVWNYIQSRINNKTEGAFKFRGQVQSLDDVQNPQAGDVYQVKVETHQTDPSTGQIIPSSVTYNDKEFAWAEHEDGTGEWIELGFNFDGQTGSGVTEQWVKNYFVGQFQQKEVLSGIIANTQLSTTLQTKEEADIETERVDQLINTVSGSIIDYINLKIAQIDSSSQTIIQNLDTISSTFNTQVENLNTTLNTTSTFLTEKIDNISSTFNTQVENLTESISTTSAVLDEKITTISTTLSSYVDQQIDQLTNYVDNKIDLVSTNIEQLREQYQANLTYVEYDEEGNIITP